MRAEKEVTTENSAVFAPMPNASVRMAVAKNPGLLSSTLTPNLMSFQKASMLATAVALPSL